MNNLDIDIDENELFMWRNEKSKYDLSKDWSDKYQIS